MPPEVVIRDKHTSASDIWSFSALMFEMVTGRLPLGVKSMHRLLLELASGTPELKSFSKVEYLFVLSEFSEFIPC